MKTVDDISSDCIEIKGSKFTAFLMPMSMYDAQMKQLRMLHPKAVHFVSAYRYLNEFDQIVEYAGDDGEPKGTSGKPTLSVLQGHDLVNTAVITVRYFGGTKLGPGGLVRAYAEAANAAYAEAKLIPYEKMFSQKVKCLYSNVSILEYETAQKHIRIITKEFGPGDVIFEIEGNQENLEEFHLALGRMITLLHPEEIGL